MVFAAIFAGGSGSRMGTDIPKQYLMLGTKPVIVHTAEAFVNYKSLDHVFILCPADRVDYTRQLIDEHIPGNDINVIEGGKTRNDTLINAIKYIYDNFPVDEDTVILTHDAVRPFVTARMICDNIKAALAFGACDTVIPATDTIVRSLDNDFISEIPVRSELYQGQTPQSFRLAELKRTVESLTAEETELLTDACKIYSVKGKPVKLVEGAVTNMKITYKDDLVLANAILGGCDFTS
ncbi:MAG: 2-C-methyl-D-erythritol 4-phosphate cytidylyltransferase [Clostridia bacterium]|nr:2-C-methyl-D-erythritol 4-phosphate cytidylyltransferase [Clostridia bacterium]